MFIAFVKYYYEVRLAVKEYIQCKLGITQLLGELYAVKEENIKKARTIGTLVGKVRALEGSKCINQSPY
jgi:hypothetical protein